MAGIVYCLTNPAMPSYVKIGTTANLESRLRQLDNTSMPLPFECVYAIEVEDPEEVESLLHETFGDQRVRKSREFFEVGEDRVVAAMQLTGGTDVTLATDVVEDEESQAALDSARKRREHFNFEMVGISPGTKLTFRGDPEVICEVVSNRRVLFQEQETNLSCSGFASE